MATTFVDAAHDSWWIPDITVITVGEREFTVPACTSLSGDWLILHLLRDNLFPGGGRDQTGSTGYPYEDFDDGWIELGSVSLINSTTPALLQTWVKVSDGSQGSVFIEWPTARSSQTIFGAMLAYRDARTWIDPDDDPDGVFQTQTEAKLTSAAGLDMSLPLDDQGAATMVDQFIYYMLHAAETGGIGHQGDVNIDADGAITQRINWTAADSFYPMQLILGDELGVNGDWPYREILETELSEEGLEEPMRWRSHRRRMLGNFAEGVVESYVGMLGGVL